MGKGDKKTKRGKIIIGSTGVTRQKRKKSTISVAAETKPVVVSEKVKKTTKKPVPKAEA
jgi:ribosomal small subunit protein bTHX